MSRALPFLRSFACRWCIALVLHELLLRTPALSHAVSGLFSPGAHTPWAGLGIATAYLILRVFVVLLWPAAVVSIVRVLKPPSFLRPACGHDVSGLFATHDPQCVQCVSRLREHG